MLPVKSLLQEPGREEEWGREEACFPLGQSDVRTHIPVGFFFFISILLFCYKMSRNPVISFLLVSVFNLS